MYLPLVNPACPRHTLYLFVVHAATPSIPKVTVSWKVLWGMLVCAVFISEQNPFFADYVMPLSLVCLRKSFNFKSQVQTNDI